MDAEGQALVEKIVATATVVRHRGFVVAKAHPERVGHQLLWCDMGEGLTETEAMTCLQAEVAFAIEYLGAHGCVPLKD